MIFTLNEDTKSQLQQRIKHEGKWKCSLQADITREHTHKDQRLIWSVDACDVSSFFWLLISTNQQSRSKSSFLLSADERTGTKSPPSSPLIPRASVFRRTWFQASLLILDFAVANLNEPIRFKSICNNDQPKGDKTRKKSKWKRAKQKFFVCWVVLRNTCMIWWLHPSSFLPYSSNLDCRWKATEWNQNQPIHCRNPTQNQIGSSSSSRKKKKSNSHSPVVTPLPTPPHNSETHAEMIFHTHLL